MTIVLAPMEGLLDFVLRDILTRVGGIDRCVSEFIRITDQLLPERVFTRIVPELLHGGRTPAGVPVRAQLLGSDPVCLAENAARLAELGPAGIDLNFGCPAPLVNRHRGGAALLEEPELLLRIAREVRRAVPAGMPYSAKMRLGVDDPGRAVECAQALVAGGVDELVVHGRTKVDGYRPPARYHWISRVREAVAVPVIANGEIWTPADYLRCREETGCGDVMLGRGAIADPLLARRIRGETTADWEKIMVPALGEFWCAVRRKVLPHHAPGRLKQWLGLLRRAWPEAEALHLAVRPLRRAEEIDALLAGAGIACPLAEAA